MGARRLFITCEHAGNYIPKEYLHLFQNAGDVLKSHRGWDPGALEIAKYLARHWHAPLIYQKISRLLIEMNRSLDSKELFSEFTGRLTIGQKNTLINKYYRSYRDEAEQKIIQSIHAGQQVLHISIHTFTPIIKGVERSVDIGLLFDDSRKEEREFCELWKENLSTCFPDKLVMLNVPYNGADDGFTTYLRQKYDDRSYMGIELEVNQKFVGMDQMATIKEGLVKSVLDIMSDMTKTV